VTKLEHVFARHRIIKERFKRYEPYRPLTDRTLAMVFEKAPPAPASLSKAGMYQMGGSVIHSRPEIPSSAGRADRGYGARDLAHGRYRDDPNLRTGEDRALRRQLPGARHQRLTNEFHPCQILADIYTYIELRGPIRGRTVAWIGDANNVAYTWLQAAQHARLHRQFRLA